jgi:hypothetical protein
MQGVHTLLHSFYGYLELLFSQMLHRLTELQIVHFVLFADRGWFI